MVLSVSLLKRATVTVIAYLLILVRETAVEGFKMKIWAL